MGKILGFLKNNLKIFSIINLILIFATIVFSFVKGSFDSAIATTSGFAAAFVLGYFGIFGKYANRTADTLKKLTATSFLLAIIVAAVFCISCIKFSLSRHLFKAIAVCLGFISAGFANIDDLKSSKK